ncbi:MAG: hypothetical protein V7K88_03185 [Nostoc sp.]|uniref:hypothetical protein n=1 Tax=Nostoc sp. TaxID=1180 RepID=UPI002FF96DB9
MYDALAIARALAHLIETVLKVKRRLRETPKCEGRSYFREGRSCYRLRETPKCEDRSYFREDSSAIRREIKLDAWIVMPNHFHGIVFIEPVTPQPDVGRTIIALG